MKLWREHALALGLPYDQWVQKQTETDELFSVLHSKVKQFQKRSDEVNVGMKKRSQARIQQTIMLRYFSGSRSSIGFVDPYTPQETNSPSVSPTESQVMTSSPTESPTVPPTESPTIPPSVAPTGAPFIIPTIAPSVSPSILPTPNLRTAAPTLQVLPIVAQYIYWKLYPFPLANLTVAQQQSYILVAAEALNISASDLAYVESQLLDSEGKFTMKDVSSYRIQIVTYLKANMVDYPQFGVDVDAFISTIESNFNNPTSNQQFLDELTYTFKAEYNVTLAVTETNAKFSPFTVFSPPSFAPSKKPNHIEIVYITDQADLTNGALAGIIIGTFCGAWCFIYLCLRYRQQRQVLKASVYVSESGSSVLVEGDFDNDLDRSFNSSLRDKPSDVVIVAPSGLQWSMSESFYDPAAMDNISDTSSDV